MPQRHPPSNWLTASHKVRSHPARVDWLCAGRYRLAFETQDAPKPVACVTFAHTCERACRTLALAVISRQAIKQIRIEEAVVVTWQFVRGGPDENSHECTSGVHCSTAACERGDARSLSGARGMMTPNIRTLLGKLQKGRNSGPRGDDWCGLPRPSSRAGCRPGRPGSAHSRD